MNATAAEQVKTGWAGQPGGIGPLARKAGAIDQDNQDGTRIFFFIDGSRLCAVGRGRHFQIWPLPPMTRRTP